MWAIRLLISVYVSALQDNRVTANGMGSSVGTPLSFTITTQVFLTSNELHMMRCPPVDRACRYIMPECCYGVAKELVYRMMLDDGLLSQDNGHK